MNGPSLKPSMEASGTSQASTEQKAKTKRKAKHPIATLSGIFKDDPLWPEFVEAMRRARAEEDAKEDVPR